MKVSISVKFQSNKIRRSWIVTLVNTNFMFVRIFGDSYGMFMSGKQVSVKYNFLFYCLSNVCQLSDDIANVIYTYCNIASIICLNESIKL